MGQEHDQLKQDIAETRERIGARSDALGYKADVPARTKDRVEDVKDRVKGAFGGSSGRDLGDTTDAMAGKARRAGGVARDNPLGLAVGAVAAGFLLGLAVPRTALEDEKIGPTADRLKDRATDLGQEAMDRGKRVAADVADTAKESGQQQAEEMKDSTQDQADQEGQAVR